MDNYIDLLFIYTCYAVWIILAWSMHITYILTIKLFISQSKSETRKGAVSVNVRGK